ncbi:hypothetical protein GWI33_020547 [Rhynchophorus ferrugineus]|uniref:Nbr1 FW domain-containing protein n=1 Tax=Rhynchophorus ferrugineus TaxID=354439 RepID=A0A834LZD0_RHYFE|nr:hypothetical protein GWI33_020547 [Rhynchophorus ferrugineus]
MNSKKKELEIAYNVNWKNRSKREGEQTSVIVIYDTPTTTLNFEVFKTYLLKNSGASGNDVKVSYLSDSGKEHPIQSQIDFQLALYAFRAKSRNGEVINLLLERISDRSHGKNRHSSDAETQFDTLNSISTVCCNLESAPEWFLSSISQLKKEITEDITAALTSVISTAFANLKPQLPTPPPHFHHYSRKCKPDKRIRKGSCHAPENSSEAKDLLKSIKLDYKLEKLERKASKYREKRSSLQSAVKSSDSEAGHSSSRSRSRDKQEETKAPKMDAKPVNSQTIVPHMLGGEIYLHQWEVQNSGEGAWNEKTSLYYTWGSKSLVPQSKMVSVPPLKPGEKGTISVRFQIPAESGTYECYWQFMHNQVRFGHWLGCQVIVDPFDLKGNRSVLETTAAAVEPPPRPLLNSSLIIPDQAIMLKEFEDFLRGPVAAVEDPAASAEALATFFKTAQDGQLIKRPEAGQPTEGEVLREVSDSVHKIHFDENGDSDSNSSEDENFSLLGDSGSSKNSFRDEFVLVPKATRIASLYDLDKSAETNPEDPSQSAQDLDKASTASLKSTASHTPKETQSGSFDDNNNASASSGNSIKLRDEDLDSVVVITVPKDEQVKEGYIYVHIDGQKVLVPKNILKTEVIDAAISLETQPGEKKSVGVVIGSNEALNKPDEKKVKSTEKEEKPIKVEEEQADDTSGNVLDGANFKPQQILQISPNDFVSLKATYGSQSDLRSEMSEETIPQQFVSGTCFSDSDNGQRLFVFPPNGPGYEELSPPVVISQPEPALVSQCEQSVRTLDPVPNFQQTPPEERPLLREAFPVSRQDDVHILPEALVNGAVSVASSAISTARSVINMIKPQPPTAPGRWASNQPPQTLREANQHALVEMGFLNVDLNATLLDRYSDDLNRVISELV